MSEHNESQSDEETENRFFDKPRNVAIILWVFYAICAALVIMDFIVHRHIYTQIEEIPAFYALYGFVACVVLVLIATQMRKVLMRGEDYYDKSNDEGHE